MSRRKDVGRFSTHEVVEVVAREVEDAEPADEFVREITEEYHRMASAHSASVVAMGKKLIEAKQMLEHGTFVEMVKNRLPFGPRYAQMLMEVARHPLLSKANHGSLLPPSPRTLYALSRVPLPALEDALKRGAITPLLERKEIAFKVLGRIPMSRPKEKAVVIPDLREALEAAWAGEDPDVALADAIINMLGNKRALDFINLVHGIVSDRFHIATGAEPRGRGRKPKVKR